MEKEGKAELKCIARYALLVAGTAKCHSSQRETGLSTVVYALRKKEVPRQEEETMEVVKKKSPEECSLQNAPNAESGAKCHSNQQETDLSTVVYALMKLIKRELVQKDTVKKAVALPGQML